MHRSLLTLLTFLAPAAATAGPTTAPAIRLEAAQAGKDVDLAWSFDDDAERVWFVDFSLGEERDFNILNIVASDGRAGHFRHPDVATNTRFNYRVRPALGAASEVVRIATTRPTQPSTSFANEGPLDTLPDPPLAPPFRRTQPGGAALRNPVTARDAAPVGLTATRSSPDSVDLRWRDRAADEDGYVVELATRPDGHFTICALLPADATSFRKVALPPTTCRFRVRAFAFGPPSNVASVNVPPALR